MGFLDQNILDNGSGIFTSNNNINERKQYATLWIEVCLKYGNFGSLTERPFEDQENRAPYQPYSDFLKKQNNLGVQNPNRPTLLHVLCSKEPKNKPPNRGRNNHSLVSGNLRKKQARYRDLVHVRPWLFRLNSGKIQTVLHQ